MTELQDKYENKLNISPQTLIDIFGKSEVKEIVREKIKDWQIKKEKAQSPSEAQECNKHLARLYDLESLL